MVFGSGRAWKPVVLELFEDLRQSVPMNPRGQPAADIPAARYRREVMELIEEFMACQPLQNP